MPRDLRKIPGAIVKDYMMTKNVDILIQIILITCCLC